MGGVYVLFDYPQAVASDSSPVHQYHWYWGGGLHQWCSGPAEPSCFELCADQSASRRLGESLSFSHDIACLSQHYTTCPLPQTSCILSVRVNRCQIAARHCSYPTTLITAHPVQTCLTRVLCESVCVFSCVCYHCVWFIQQVSLTEPCWIIKFQFGSSPNFHAVWVKLQTFDVFCIVTHTQTENNMAVFKRVSCLYLMFLCGTQRAFSPLDLY